MFGIEHKVEKAARKAAAFSVGGLLAMVGAGFLTAAAFMVLTEMRDPVFAAGIIGAVYVGLAALAFAVGTSSRRRPVASVGNPAGPKAGLSPLQLVVVSFLQGLEQGRRAR